MSDSRSEMIFRHIKDQAEIISDHIFESMVLQEAPDGGFLEDHALQLLDWVRTYREKGTPYVFQPHSSHSSEARRKP